MSRSISRSIPSLARGPAAAFDFDVVTDVPARPPRKPQAVPEPARDDSGAPESSKREAAQSL